MEQQLAESAAWLVNPLGFTPSLWLGGVLLKALLVGLLDLIVLGSLYLVKYKTLPSRNPPIMKGLVQLSKLDWSFICFNQTIEYVFVCHLFQFSSTSLVMVQSMDNISLLNSILPVYLTLVVDDFFYYFAHRIMHMPALYPYIHKHHHRQALPKRGYFDAANEHPLEQVIALSLVMISLHIVSNVVEMHVISVVIFLAVYAITALLNHTEFDVQFGILGLFYSVRVHEMHHRFPQTNYVQNVAFWDKLFGTYREYKGNPMASAK